MHANSCPDGLFVVLRFFYTIPYPSQHIFGNLWFVGAFTIVFSLFLCADIHMYISVATVQPSERFAVKS